MESNLWVGDAHHDAGQLLVHHDLAGQPTVGLAPGGGEVEDLVLVGLHRAEAVEVPVLHEHVAGSAAHGAAAVADDTFDAAVAGGAHEVGANGNVDVAARTVGADVGGLGHENSLVFSCR